MTTTIIPANPGHWLHSTKRTAAWPVIAWAIDIDHDDMGLDTRQVYPITAEHGVLYRDFTLQYRGQS